MSNSPEGSPVNLTAKERLLVLVLRIIGVVLISAIFPVFFPSSWMVTLNDQLGLAGFPDQPLSWYLARSLSLMYFAHGVMVLSLSTDVRRYWPLISVLGYLNLTLGIVLIGIDVVTSMSVWWTVGEGPSVILGGVALLVLVRLCDKERCE
jgi:hypothetical protein